MSTMRVLLEPRWDDAASPTPAVDLILALPWPKALARALQTAACMGVRRIHVINAWRVDKSFWQSPQLERDALHENLVLGCEQGGTTWLPDIATHRLLMSFLRGPLREACQEGRWHAVIAHPRTDQLIESVVERGVSRPVMVAIGPERGWIDRELASFHDLGFASVSLGEPILRVEAAVTTCLAQLSLLRRL